MPHKIRFTQEEICRAVKGAMKAGVKIAKVEISSEGKIILFCAGAGKSGELPPLDAWRAERGTR